MDAVRKNTDLRFNLIQPALVLFFLAVITRTLIAGVKLGIIINDQVNFRNGPGLNYPIPRQLNRGDIVIQTNTADQWAHVQLLDGAVGWVNLTMFEANSGEMFLPDLQLTKRGNLRFAPTTQSDIVLSMEPPRILRQIFQTGSWHAVITEDSTFGWVHDIITKEIPSSGVKLQVTTKSRIRSGPGTDYTIINTVSPLTQLKPIAHIGNWYLIDIASDQYGWIYQNLVKIVLPVQNVNEIVKIRTNGHVRSGPGLEYSIINRVASGTTLIVDKINHDWYHINPQQATEGWIHRILIDTLFQQSEVARDTRNISLDSIKTMIEIAERAHLNQNYRKSIHLYKMALPLIEAAYQNDPTNPCLRYYYALSKYALTQDLNLDPGQTYEQAYHLLKTTNIDSTCSGKIADLIHTMEKAITIRLEILSVFGNTKLSEKKLIDYGNNASSIFPFVIESEIYRLIGRYFSSNKNDSQSAVAWQKKSVAIYQTVLNNGIDLNNMGLENYFYALMELGVNQIHLGIDQGYDNFDAASKLIEKYNNNYWRNYFNRTLEAVSR